MEDILLNEIYDLNAIQRLCLLNHAFNDRYRSTCKLVRALNNRYKLRAITLRLSREYGLSDCIYK